MDIICFHNPDEDNGYLSNWYPSPFTVDDIAFSSMEQFMMYRKAICFGDEAVAAQILSTSDVAEIKSLGRQVSNYDESMWNGIRQIVVYGGLLAKFSQNEELKGKLKATENAVLAECAVKDRIWGIGLSMKDPNRLNKAKWNGQNLLGYALMMVRERLQQDYSWEQRKLSELATMHARIGWQNLRTSEFLDSGDYMLITGTDFEDGKVNYSTCHYVEKERYEQDKNIQIKNGNILITKDGTLGKVAYVENLNMPATLNAGVFNVEVKDKNETDGKYLFQFLKAPFLMDYVAQKATGGTIKHLNQNILVNFSISIPSKAEQIRIGEYFSNLDNLITLHQRLYFWCKLRLIIRFL